MKHSDPVALDRHDIHALLDLIGGYGAALAAGIIATLSVCAALFIYRSVRGPRGKARGDNGSDTTAAAEEESSARRRRRERGEPPKESTEDYQEGKQKKCFRASESRGDIDLLATDSILLPTEVTEKDLNESTLKDLEEITDELLTELEPESEDRADSDLDQSMEMDPDKPDDTMEYEDHVELGDGGRECVGDICKVLPDVDAFQGLDCHEMGESVKEKTEEHLRDHDQSETGLNIDTDEPSETESAQEILNERLQDVLTCKPQDDLLSHNFTTQSSYFSHQTVDPSNHCKIRFEADHKTSTMEEVENTSNKFEEHHDWRFPQTNNFDCCCYDKKMNMTQKMKGQLEFNCGRPDVESVINHQHHSKCDYPIEPPHQNYLGFHTDNSFIGGSSTQVSLSRESGERKADEEGASKDKKREKNEISIMDAIMDNNEWLNVGGPEFRDLPWLTPPETSACSAPSSDEKHTKGGKEELETLKEQLKDNLVKEDEELANKRVATVQPLPQPVHVTFRTHYITYSSSQLVAVTGSLQDLGAWESFFPLRRAKDGFWANTITLPMESQVEWKFVLVEDGKISRWEECGNRYLVLTNQDEELYLDKCWGCV